jgi:hypothetical protein
VFLNSKPPVLDTMCWALAGIISRCISFERLTMRWGQKKGLFSWSLSKRGSMKEHFDVKIYILRPILTKQIPKLRAVWGKKFEKGTRKVKKLF